MCEQCDTWYHTHCQNVHDSASRTIWSVYCCLGMSSVSRPKLQFVLFDLHGVETSCPSSGDISSLSLNSLDSQELCGPMHTSSPICPRAQRAMCSRPLRIINVNCQSLVHKKPAFFNLLDSVKPDVIIITESWFNSSINNAEYFSAEHFSVYRRDGGAESPGGGVIVAVNKDFHSMHEVTLEDNTTETVWVKVAIKGCKNLFIAGSYRAKVEDNDFLDAISTSLCGITSNSNNSVLLGGDYNFSGWNWLTGSIKPQ